MKYLKYFEKIKGKNVKIGGIYRIRPYHKSDKSDHMSTIPLAKIIDKLGSEIISFVTYFQTDDCDKLLFKNYNKKILLNIATPDEIEYFNKFEEKFESKERSKKYNL
jgi:hypothetical protein